MCIPYLLREDALTFFNNDGNKPKISCSTFDGKNLVGILDDDATFSVLVENAVVATSQDFVTAFIVMFSSYYVFNLAYPAKLDGTLCFIQKFMLSLGDQVKVKPKVLTLIAKLKDIVS